MNDSFMPNMLIIVPYKNNQHVIILLWNQIHSFFSKRTMKT